MNSKFSALAAASVHPLLRAHASHEVAMGSLNLTYEDSKDNIFGKYTFKAWCDAAHSSIDAIVTVDDCYSLYDYFPEDMPATCELLARWSSLCKTIDDLCGPWSRCVRYGSSVPREKLTPRSEALLIRFQELATTAALACSAFEFVKKNPQSAVLPKAVNTLYTHWETVACSEVALLKTAVQARLLATEHSPSPSSFGLRDQTSSKYLAMRKWEELWHVEAKKVSTPDEAQHLLGIVPFNNLDSKLVGKLQKMIK